MRQALTIGLIVLGIWFYETMRPVGQPPGVLAPEPPRITPAADKPAIFEREGHVLTALAGFVPCADTGIRHTLRCESPRCRW